MDQCSVVTKNFHFPNYAILKQLKLEFENHKRKIPKLKKVFTENVGKSGKPEKTSRKSIIRFYKSKNLEFFIKLSTLGN